MKKNYIQPAIKVREIHLTSIIASSDLRSGGSNGGGSGPINADSKSMDFDFGFEEE